MGSERIGVVVGLTAEARIARRLGLQVAVGGGSAAGALAAARRMVAGGASGLISFGLAGGLDPALQPGALLVPTDVLLDGERIRTDAGLSRRLGGPMPACLLGAEMIVADTAEKHRLWQATGAAAVDLESGAVARVATEHGLGFAALRAVCDPAGRSLPPAALAALDPRGAIRIARVLTSLAAQPGQLRMLLSLAADATAARRALLGRVNQIAPWCPPGEGD